MVNKRKIACRRFGFMLKRSLFESLVYAFLFGLSFMSCSTHSLKTNTSTLSNSSIERVSREITKNIISYPRELLIPSDSKISRTVGKYLLQNGLDVVFYRPKFGEERSKNAGLVEVTEHREHEVIVIIDTPYFTTSQLFDSRDGEPTSNQSLMLKPAPYNKNSQYKRNA